MSCAAPIAPNCRAAGVFDNNAIRAVRNIAVGNASQYPQNPRIPEYAKRPRMLLWGMYRQRGKNFAMLYLSETSTYGCPQPVPTRGLWAFDVAMSPRFSTFRALVDVSSAVLTLEIDWSGLKIF